MPFVLIIAGIVFLVAAVRNTQQDLFLLLAKDFTGPNNFVYWFLSILLIGAIGYIPRMKPISDGFLILVILVLFLKGGKSEGGKPGFFESFNQQISATQSSTPIVATAAGAGAGGTTGGSSGGGTGVSANIPLPGGGAVRVGR